MQVFACRAQARTVKAARAATPMAALIATALVLRLPHAIATKFYPGAIRKTLGCVCYARLCMAQGVFDAPQAHARREIACVKPQPCAAVGSISRTAMREVLEHA
jgi:hypothetical protein